METFAHDFNDFLHEVLAALSIIFRDIPHDGASKPEYHVKSRTNKKWWTGKYMEGSGSGLAYLPYRTL